METLAIIVGGAGVLLVLVGLIGGDFTFSGSVVPKVGSISRVFCFAIGGVFMLTAVVLAFGASVPPAVDPVAEHAGSGSETRPADPTAGPATFADPTTFVGYVVVGSGRTAYVFELPDSSSPIVAELLTGDPVQILCTAQGEAVTSPTTGVTSSLWNGTSDGGFLPDVLVDTGTDQAVMPTCR